MKKIGVVLLAVLLLGNFFRAEAGFEGELKDGNVVDLTLTSVFFPEGSSVVDSSSLSILDENLEWMKNNFHLVGKMRVVLLGRHDSKVAENPALAIERAESIKQYLVNGGVSESFLEVIREEGSETEFEDSRKNRSVSFKLIMIVPTGDDQK